LAAAARASVGFSVVHGVDVALLGQHRVAVGRHQQRAEGVAAHRHGALGHGARAPQQARDLVRRSALASLPLRAAVRPGRGVLLDGS
jgi:hypothetical protein